MPPENKEQNSNQEKNNLSSKDSLHKKQQESHTSNTADNNSSDYNKKSFQWFRNLKPAEKFSVIALVINFLTLLAFIGISTVQISKTDEALERADTSNAYTRRIIESSEKSTKAELRAFVHISGAEFETFKVGKKVNIFINVINTGKTPAYNVRISFANKMGGKGVYQVDLDEWEDSLHSQSINRFLLGSTDTSQFFFPDLFTLTKRDSIDCIDGEKFYFIHGLATYEDLFRDKHFTRFCLQYEPVSKEFVYYKRFNEADRQPY